MAVWRWQVRRYNPFGVGIRNCLGSAVPCLVHAEQELACAATEGLALGMAVTQASSWRA